MEMQCACVFVQQFLYVLCVCAIMVKCAIARATRLDDGVVAKQRNLHTQHEREVHLIFDCIIIRPRESVTTPHAFILYLYIFYYLLI